MGSGGCSGADLLLSWRVGFGPSITRGVEREDRLRPRGRCNIVEECSEASGVARVGVTTVMGLGGALATITGGSGSRGTITVLLVQPMGQWHVVAHLEGTHFKNFDRVRHASNPCEFLVEMGQI